jgi:hypothetical protein
MIWRRAALRIGLALGLFFPAWSAWADEAPPPIAIGFYTPVFRDVPRADVEVSLKFWIDELAHLVKLKFKPIRFYDHMEDLKRDMKSGEINFIVATSMGVVQYFSMDELRDGFSGLKEVPDHLFLVVKRSSGIRTPADLAGKRVAILEGDELSEVYLDTLMMKALGKAAVTRAPSVTHEKRSSTLVHRVFFNQADAALVRRNTYESAMAMNPQIDQQLQVLETYSFKGRSPHIGLFSARVAPQDAQAITRSAMTMGSTSRGRQVLDIYHADNMVLTKVSDLDPFLDLLTQYRTLKSALAPTLKKGAK